MSNGRTKPLGFSTYKTMIREPAFAKVNLFLEVVGRLPSGYHHLQSLMVFADVGEWVSVSAAPAWSFEMSGPQAAVLSGDSNANLAVKAARAFNDAGGFDQAYALHLHKVMPVSSGIGGGSADAAAVLRAVNQLHGKPLKQDALLQIGTALGADVPACILSRPVLLDGPDAQLRPAAVRGCQHAVLVNPREGVSTPQVFKALNAPLIGDVPALQATSWSLEDIAKRRNDLRPPAQRICSAIGDALACLESIPNARFAQMSGSGATCFALFDHATQAATALERIQAEYPQWWSVRAAFVEGGIAQN